MAEGKHYICARCGEHFEGTRTEEDCQAEMKANFGDTITTDDCDVVCDECYHEIMKQVKN